MKRIALPALALAVMASSLVFTSCKKDKDKSRTELLTDRNWRISGFTSVTPTDTTDLYVLVPVCEKDNFLKFNTNKSLLFDEGPTKCEPSDPQSETGSWDFTSNETKLTIQEPGDPAEVYNIVEISESRLKIMRPFSFGGVEGTINVTFTAF